LTQYFVLEIERSLIINSSRKLCFKQKIKTKKLLRNLKKMASLFDLNGDGQITVHDFHMAARMMGHHGLMSHVLTKAVFNMLDTDGNGVLNGDEAFGLFRNYGNGGGRYVGYGGYGGGYVGGYGQMQPYYGGYGGYGGYSYGF